MNEHETQLQQQHNNSNKKSDRPIWLKAKRYGLGWYPATWQAWLIIGIYAAIVIGSAFIVDISQELPRSGLGTFLIIDIGATIILIILSARFGEKAKWRWGNKDEGINSQK